MEPYSDENLQLNWIFMHDNDLKHKSKSVTKWITEKKIRVSNWLAQSPDLNPIENLWYEVKKVKQMNMKNKEELGVQYKKLGIRNQLKNVNIWWKAYHEGAKPLLKRKFSLRNINVLFECPQVF